MPNLSKGIIGRRPSGTHSSQQYSSRSDNRALVPTESERSSRITERRRGDQMIFPAGLFNTDPGLRETMIWDEGRDPVPLSQYREYALSHGDDPAEVDETIRHAQESSARSGTRSEEDQCALDEARAREEEERRVWDEHDRQWMADTMAYRSAARDADRRRARVTPPGPHDRIIMMPNRRGSRRESINHSRSGRPIHHSRRHY